MGRSGRSIFFGVSIGVGTAVMASLFLTEPTLQNLPAFVFAGALGGLLNGLVASRIERDRLVRMMIFAALCYLPTALAIALLFGESGFFALVYAPVFAPFMCAGVLALEVLSRDELPMPLRRSSIS